MIGEFLPFCAPSLTKEKYQMLKLNPQEMYAQVLHMLPRGVTPMIHGSPGISKSAIMHKVIEHFNAEPIDWRGSSADPTD